MSKKVLILGVDGYLGRNLEHYLKCFKDYEVKGIDCFLRRALVDSLFPLAEPQVEELFNIATWSQDKLDELLNQDFDSVVHLAEMPSAPWSMSHPQITMYNNLCGTSGVIEAIRKLAKKPHLIKLGTMGEYGDWIYDGRTIPETERLSVSWRGKEMLIPTPRWAGSYYHWSKVFDSQLLDWASKTWGLTVTDINQGPVWGTRIENEPIVSRFDYDSDFGTVVNRFVTQAVAGEPLTVYGKGNQTRGFINLIDSMRMIKRLIDYPPSPWTFNIINQLTEVQHLNSIAKLVKARVEDLLGRKVVIEHIKNPRVEKEDHDYRPAFETTYDSIGHISILLADGIDVMIKDVEAYKDKIDKELFAPKVNWR